METIDKDGRNVPYTAGELLVTYKEYAASSRATELVPEKTESKVEEEIEELDAQLLAFPEAKSKGSEKQREKILEEKKEELEKDPRVAFVDYNYLRKPFRTPNDTRFAYQWSMENANFPKAWSRAWGSGAKIAIVDGGADARHPDLRDKVIAQRDFVDEDMIAEDSLRGHGTHVSGVAAAATNNRKGISGGCPGCELIIAKVIDPYRGEDADVARGIVWSVEQGSEVLNLSIGGPGSSKVLKRAVNYATRNGVVVVGAAGNYAEYGNPKIYPAAYPNVVAVAATDKRDQRASFSEYGGWVDVAAPGVNILSTLPNGKYGRDSGTSFSAPFVSGLAGLLASEGLSADEIRKRIETGAADAGKRGRDPYYGHGRINAFASVKGTPSPPAKSFKPIPEKPKLKPSRCTITGTKGSDILRGTRGSDVICGLSGNDVIRGAAGNDVVRGGPGNDLVIGGPGRDLLLGGSGRDMLNSKDGAGGDSSNGGLGRDLCLADRRDKTTKC